MSHISLVASVSKGWLHAAGGFCFGQLYYLDPLYRRERDTAIEAFLQERFPEHALYNLESNLVQLAHRQPQQALVGGIQPNLIQGVCLGAELVYYEDKDIDIAETQLLAGLKSVSELPTPTQILAHPFLQQLDQQIADLHQSHPELVIIPPFFWDTSGRATIHGFITNSLKFFGQDIFIKMVRDAQFVKDLHAWLADVTVTLIRHYAGLGCLPVTSVHIGECCGTMIRDRDYLAFVIPYVNRLAEELGPIRLHSCGKSDHLLAAFKEINKLAVLDTGSNTSVKRIREQLGNDLQIDLAPPHQLLLKGADKVQLLAWLDQTLEENGSGPLQIGYHLEPGYALENCLAIHDELAKRGLIPGGRLAV
jgi:hypothetical protein